MDANVNKNSPLSTPSKLRERASLVSPSSSRGIEIDSRVPRKRVVLGKSGAHEVLVSDIDVTVYPSNVNETTELDRREESSSSPEVATIIASRNNSARGRIETDAVRHPFMFDLLSIEVKDTYDGNFSVDNINKPTHVCNGTNSCLFTAMTRKKDGSTSRVIVKKVAVGAATDELALTEFYRERHLLSRVSHTNIVDIVGAGRDASGSLPVPFLILEHLEGGSLSAYLAKYRSFHSRPFKYPRFLELARQFADALQYLHYGFSPDAVIIHRDLKPDNISFTSNGTLKIIDFGLSICIKRGSNDSETFEMTGNTGSLRYMAPEVAKNLSYNEKVDVYSFAIVVYQMLTGVAPFSGLKKVDFMRRVVENHERPPFGMDDYGRRVNIDKELQILLENSWSRTISRRPTSRHLYESLCELVKNAPEDGSNGCTIA